MCAGVLVRVLQEGVVLCVGEESVQRGSKLGGSSREANMCSRLLGHDGWSSDSSQTAHTGCERDEGGGETEEELTEEVL